MLAVHQTNLCKVQTRAPQKAHTVFRGVARGNYGHYQHHSQKQRMFAQQQSFSSLNIPPESQVCIETAPQGQKIKGAFVFGNVLVWLCGLLFLQSASADDDTKNQKAKQVKKSDSSPESLSNCTLPVEECVLTFAPEVPPPITRKHPVLLKVNMNTFIKELPIDTAYTYDFWSFNGQVPGPFVRARVGDVMDVNFTNQDETGMQHNIDWHCVHGPGGGAPLLTADQAETKHARFRLLRPGLFIYHCSVGPVGLHVANGMYGLMLVEPEEGLAKVDKEFYVLQSEIYSEEAPRDKGSRKLEASYTKGLAEDASYVVFNGRMGSLIEELGGHPLEANTGDKVRIFFGNAGPNYISSFHVIGGLFDKVYREGDLVSPPARYLQTTLVPAGGAALVEMDVLVPGIYTLVDHALFRLEKGATGFLEVKGPDRPDIYHSEAPPKRCENCKIHP